MGGIGWAGQCILILPILTTRPLRGSPPLGKAQGIINDLIFVIKPREDCQLKQAGGEGEEFFIQNSIDKSTYTALLYASNIFLTLHSSQIRERAALNLVGRPPFLRVITSTKSK